MNDTKALAPPETPSEPPPTARPWYADRYLPHWLHTAGFMVLALAILYVWLTPPVPAPPTAELAALQQQMRALDSRIARAEQHTPSSPVDVAGLTARIDALEKRLPLDQAPLQTRLYALEQRPALDPARLDALEKRPIVDLAALQSRLAALEQRPVPDPALATRLDALAGRLDSLSARTQTEDTEAGRRVEALDGRLSQAEAAANRVSAIADRASRLARIQSAEAALAAGQKLGDLPGAPASVARFASVNPPTLPHLRLTFPAADRAAREAAQPDTEGKPFLERVWSRAQELVTIRQGDKVLIGVPVAGVLARARAALEAGDLAATVEVLSTLTGEPAKAMAPWLGEARALLDAQAGLAAMAASG